MATKTITVELKVDADTPARLVDKERLLTRISNLQADDQQRIIEICENPKALTALAKNWRMLKAMF